MAGKAGEKPSSKRCQFLILPSTPLEGDIWPRSDQVLQRSQNRVQSQEPVWGDGTVVPHEGLGAVIVHSRRRILSCAGDAPRHRYLLVMLVYSRM